MDILIVIGAVVLLYFAAKITFKILKALVLLAVIGGAAWFLFFQ